MKEKMHVLVLTALMLGMVSAAWAESASVLLEKGIHKEQALGDLDAAMKIYRQVIEQAKANRRYVAEAHYRLGTCYLKKGDKTRAAAAFRRLVRSYPQQKKFVVKAEAELAKLIRPPDYLPLNQVVERRINDDGMNRDFLIDLDTGKLFTPLRERRMTNDEHMQWMVAQGIDAGAETSAAGPGLWGIDMVVIPRAGEKWESINLVGIRDELARGKPGTPAVMSALGELPRSYAFKTREGSIGVLQILQLVNEPPRHIKIRYKLLEHGAGAARALPFPEFVGCRIKERVALKVVPKGKEQPPSTGREIYQYSHLEIAWEVDPNIAKQVRRFAVSVRDPKDDGKYLWQVADLPADTSRVVYGKAKGRTIRPAEELPPGQYRLDVYAYDALQEKLDPAKALGTASVKLTVKPLMYTQISINDVQPGGTIRLRLIQQNINTSSAPVKQRRFINGDCVEVERMSDDRGRPVKFTVKHEGNIYRYRATLNEPVPPGKAVLMASEGTVSGMIKRSGRVCSFRQHHWPGSARTRRLEVYRLPKGAELLNTTPGDMARRQRDGRWELFVEKIVPAGGSITTGFRYRLGEGELVAEEPLKLAAAPWKDGEQMHLKLNSMVGAELGGMIYTAGAVKSGDADAWRVESFMVIPIRNMHQFTRVDARRDSFAPISGRTFNNVLGDHRAEYLAGKVKLTAQGPGRPATTREISLQEIAYDNEQALFLIRRLPLTEGYRASFPIFPVLGGTTLECRIRVVGKENLTVPAGGFDCHKVVLAVYSGELKALEHTLWFSADGNKYLVKYDSGAAIMELNKAVVRKRSEPGRFADKKAGVSLTTPAGWHAYLEAGEEFRLRLLPPELKAWALATSRRREPEIPSARRYAEQAATKVQDFFKGYKVRPGSWAELEIGGLPAARYVADYQDKPGDMVECRTYLLGKAKVYWFVLRIEKDDFDAARKEFDTIVESLRIAPAEGRGEVGGKPAEKGAV